MNLSKLSVVASLFLISLNFWTQITNEIYPLKDVKEGAVAKGYTVVKGQEVFEFEAEVVGVQKIGSTDIDYIICKIKGKPFDECGVVAAMSGSPLFIDNKFLGAIAIGWFFAKEPLCAATPAEKMVELYQKNFSGLSSSYSNRNVTLEDFLSKMNSLTEDPKKFLATLEKQSAELSQGATATFDKNAPINPGDMIGVQLISGDLNLTAFGTVSSVKENKFLAFGHSFLGFGEVDFPVVKAKVTTIMPSFAFSFKMASSKEEIGRMVLDTQYGVLCEKGVKSDTLPIEISFTDSKGILTQKKVNIVRHPEISKMLFFLSLSEIFDTLENNKISYHALLESAEFDFKDGKQLNLKRQIFGGNEPLLELSSFLSEIFSLLTSNPYKKPDLNRIRINIATKSQKSEGSLVQIKAQQDCFFRGEKIGIEGVFQNFEEAPKSFNFSLPTENLPSSKVKIVVGDSISIYKRWVKSLEYIPNSFEKILSVLDNMLEGGYVYAAIFADEESYLLENSRLFNLPITLRNSAPETIQNINPKSSEKTVFKPLPVLKSGFFTSELELKVEIKERKEQ
ncbi:MAG: hypothetical protein N2445_00290 [Acidobacteria bacterium]|nr:hypothetical protein [Acidobacteriota bacterium]